MGLFDRVRQVLAKAEHVLPGQGKSADGGTGTADAGSGPGDADTRAADAGTQGPVAGGQRRRRTHTLQPGQSLAEVAALHDVSVEDLAALNQVDPDLVFAGQVLRIPHP